MRGGQNQRVAHAVGRRNDHHDLAHAGHVGRYRIHQDRRRIGRLAARHVQAHAFQRGHTLAQHRTVGFGETPLASELALMKRPDPVGGRLQYPARFGGERIERRPQLGSGDFQLGHRLRRHAVETLRVFQQRRIAPAADVLDDRFGLPVDVAIECGRRRGELAKLRFELRRLRIERANFHDSTALPIASIKSASR